MNEKIKIKGAREHNLKNVNLEIPRNKMTIFTGLSGSGKSSLAFDTIFAEGQRRYMESLSSYARQFLEKMDKPDVDEITGLSPAISIDQKSHSKNPRSTVATITEIYDYLRVLFARVGEPHCPECGKKIRKMTIQEIVDSAIEFSKTNKGKGITILAPVVIGRKGEYYQLLYDYLSAGFYEARVDGKFRSLKDRIELSRYKAHTIEIMMDKIPYGADFSDKENRLRLSEAIESAVNYADGLVTFLVGKKELSLSSKFACPDDNFSLPEIEPRLFSFNSPYGACEECHGLGTQEKYTEKLCKECKGERLREEALAITINGKNISQVTHLSIDDSINYFKDLESSIDKNMQEIASAPLREIISRLKFLLDVGLDYLTLDRRSGTLSGGEAQRIRLASQIGSQLTGTLYVLDEPTIGLHQRDNDKLIKTLHDLKDLGNTIIVVEHDENTIRSGDYLVDIGPGPGVHGGEIIIDGPIPEILEDKKKKSLTLDYLRGDKKIAVPKERRSVKKIHDSIKIRGAKQNNLKNINVDIPLRRLNVITGVSGSGKSTLMVDILYKNLANKFNKATYKGGAVNEIKGLEYINRVINIDQSPIGRTPRSNPATYVGIWGYVRDLFASTKEARARGYKKGRFSFNTKGGRCENCEGHGTISIEMHFLPTVYVKCDICDGKRYDRETLEVHYKDKNIYDILQMTIEEAKEFFDDIAWIKDRLKILEEVGLGYLRLGQPAPTLSGGEAQRIKLASELGKRDTRKTLYLLDEPTTGLHFEDVNKLIEVLQRLVKRGNTVVIIEHNLDVIKSADWLIDLGPEGGEKGGEVVACGTPETVSKKRNSATGKYLKNVL
ncbi:MAG: excinuclease ABC subunit UvrA [Candidatus Paceibacterota bacterium]